MPFCSRCGAQVSDSSAFCASCGTSVSQTNAPAFNQTSAVSPWDYQGEIKTYLVPNIILFLLGGNLISIIGFIFSCATSSALGAQDYNRARGHSNVARIFMYIALVIDLLIIGLFLLLIIVGAANS